LKIQHLEAKSNTADPEIFPSNIRYDMATLGEDDIDVSIDHDLAIKRAALRRSSKQRPSDREPQSSPTAHLPAPTLITSRPAQPMPSLERFNLDVDTQITDADHIQPVSATETQGSTQARTNLSRLQNMLRPLLEACSGEETQVLTPHSAQTKMLDFVAHLPQLQLSNVKLVELRGHKRIAANNLFKSKIGRDMESCDVDIVECLCDHNEEDGHMIQCDFCDKWQHSVCHGYVSEADPRLPDVHACYKCLLEEKEGYMLKKLSGLTLLRRGAIVTIGHGYSKDLELSSQMSMASPSSEDTFSN
jgi:hypothetical protein